MTVPNRNNDKLQTANGKPAFFLSTHPNFCIYFSEATRNHGVNLDLIPGEIRVKYRKFYAATICAILLITGTLVTPRSGTGLEEKTHVPDEVLIRFKDGIDEWNKDRVRGLVNGLTVRRYRHIGVEKVLLGPSHSVKLAIKLLEANPLVEFAEPNWRIQFLGMPYEAPDDPGFTSGDQWHLITAPYDDIFLPPDTMVPVDVDIDAPEVWGVMASVFHSSMIAVVGVLDSGCGEAGYFSNSTGYIPGHIDLPNSVLFANTAELSIIGSDNPADANSLIDDVNGWDWVDDDNLPADDELNPLKWIPYHGTRISGIIAAQWGNGADVAGIGKGHLKILPLRSDDIAGIIEGIDYAIGMTKSGKPVRVLNASWHVSNDSLSLKTAIEQTGEAGIALSAAAGNRGHSNDDSLLRVYPAEYTKIPLTNVLAVAATGTDGALTDFSNYGQASVQIAAPGDNIYSTAGGAGGYTSRSGTSFSTPIAAAALGLVFAAHPDISPEQAISRLMDGGDFDPRLAGQVSSGKRVNLAGALAPFYPYSDLVPLDGTVKQVFMYTDIISASFGTITGAVSSDNNVAVMTTDSSGGWSVVPISPGTALFTLSFGDTGAPIGSYETGPWRVTAISPFYVTVRSGETTEEPFVSLLPGNVSWSVMDPTIGEIDENGWFTGKRPGLTSVVLSIDGTPVDSSGTIRVLAPYSNDDDGSDSCFIATAAYGSAMESHINILRRFRDRYLSSNRPGRALVSLYNYYSPPLAEFIASSGFLRFITRAALLPFMGFCWAALYFGLPLTTFIFLVLLVLTAAALRHRLSRKTY
jgi:hypothetical protein